MGNKLWSLLLMYRNAETISSILNLKMSFVACRVMAQACSVFLCQSLPETICVVSGLTNQAGNSANHSPLECKATPCHLTPQCCSSQQCIPYSVSNSRVTFPLLEFGCLANGPSRHTTAISPSFMFACTQNLCCSPMWC